MSMWEEYFWRTLSSWTYMVEADIRIQVYSSVEYSSWIMVSSLLHDWSKLDGGKLLLHFFLEDIQAQNTQ